VVATGELVFARHGRHLVMLFDPTEEADTARCHFEATLRGSGGKIVVDSIRLGRAVSNSLDRELPPTGGVVTAEIMRATRLDAIVSMTLRRMRTEGEHVTTLHELPEQAFWSAWAPWRHAKLLAAMEQIDVSAQQQRPRRPGRAPLSDDHYRLVAQLAIDLYESGRRGIHNEIATRYKRAPRTVGDWVRKAVDLGFLAPGKPGVVSYVRGPRLPPEEPESTTKKPQ
jgi:hypothetical protein